MLLFLFHWISVENTWIRFPTYYSTWRSISGGVPCSLNLGVFLGAMSFFLAPLCRAVVKQSNSFKGFEQIQFCAAAFSGEVPDGIMVLHCTTSTCLLFQVGQELRTVSLKYFIFCAALKMRMAFIIHIDDEYAPLFFPTKMYYHLQWTKKGQTRWCYLQ